MDRPFGSSTSGVPRGVIAPGPSQPQHAAATEPLPVMAHASARFSPVTRPAPRIPIPQAAAACTAFAAFAVSVFVGIASDNPTTTVIGRALLAMLLGFAGGFALGLVCEWIVREEVARMEDEMVRDSARSDPAGHAGDGVDVDGLTGVDVIEDDAASLASDRVGIDDRRGR